MLIVVFASHAPKHRNHTRATAILPPESSVATLIRGPAKTAAPRFSFGHRLEPQNEADRPPAHPRRLSTTFHTLLDAFCVIRLPEVVRTHKIDKLRFEATCGNQDQETAGHYFAWSLKPGVHEHRREKSLELVYGADFGATSNRKRNPIDLWRGLGIKFG